MIKVMMGWLGWLLTPTMLPKTTGWMVAYRHDTIHDLLHGGH